jgi:hypothetical protein
MKAIKINKIRKARKSSILTREKYHSIFLGNGLTCYFSNEKKAYAYMASTNRFLNNKVLELNKIYIEVWAEQRSMYLVFYKLFSNDMTLSNFQVQIEKALDMIMTRSKYQNGNHFTFKWFYHIIELLKEWNEYLMELLKSKNRFYNLYDLEILNQRLDWIKSMFDNWGKEHAENAPPCFYDNSKKNFKYESPTI